MAETVQEKGFIDTEGAVSVSLLPHYPQNSHSLRVFCKKGHKRDAILNALTAMKNYTKPQINKSNPKKWFVFFNYKVPPELSEYFKSSNKRFKIYKDINRQTESEKSDYANRLRDIVEKLLLTGEYTPFENYLENLNKVKKETSAKAEAKRGDMLFDLACNEFIISRIENKVDTKTISTYKNTLAWLQKYIENKAVDKITRLDVSDALKKATLERNWGNTTFNKQRGFAVVVFNFFENEEYIPKNPIKIAKKKTSKQVHRWYDKETASIVKSAVLSQNKPLYFVMAFVYHILVRNKAELLKMKIGDIDFDLQRIRFRSEVSKNKNEQYRNISPEFMKVLEVMGIKGMDKNFYIFGKGGVPCTWPCSQNFFSLNFKKIRDLLGIDSDFTIYSWKHTRVCHEIMKKTDPYTIMHLCRHSDLGTTQDYIRDFDLNLFSVYKECDLIF